jgi:hypothetical protein
MTIVMWKRLSYAFVAVALTAIALAAKDVRTISVRDECDPATFDAAIGPGTCIGDGDVTFAEFLAEVPNGGHEKWRFNESVTEADVAVNANNRGGETHTFTPVAKFGGGFIDLLNTEAPIPECAVTLPDGSLAPAGTALATLIPPDGKDHLTTPLEKGANLFQCCIHPWMRTTVTRR